jgi:hypothetical protein
MKNFSELLDTDLKLEVVVNNKLTVVDLHDFLMFNESDTVTIDGLEILPKYHYLVDNKILTIQEPFYQWYHRISGYGWLLTPH